MQCRGGYARMSEQVEVNGSTGLLSVGGQRVYVRVASATKAGGAAQGE